MTASAPVTKRELVDLLKADFYAFCAVTKLIYPISEQPHREMCERIAELEPDFRSHRQRKRLFLAPRGSFKTSLIIAFAIWLLVKHPQIKILIYRASRETACAMLLEIKQQLQNNPVILDLFGDLSKGATKWDEGAISIGTRKIAPGDRDPSIGTAGIGSRVTGAHPDLILADDVVDETNYDSPKQMLDARSLLLSMYPLLPPYGTLLVTGTEWPAHNLYSWIRENNQRALQNDDDPSYTEYIRAVYYTDDNGDQALFFPDRLSEEFLEQMRRDIADERFYWCWYHNEQKDPNKKPFKVSDFNFFDGDYRAYPRPHITLLDEVYAGEKVYVWPALLIDTAETHNERSDAFALVVAAIDADGNWYFLEAQEIVDLPTVVAEEIIRLLLTYQPAIMVSEHIDPSIMMPVAAFIERTKMVIRVEKYFALTDEPRGKRGKHSRIWAMQPYSAKRLIWLRRGQYTSPLLRQLERYPAVEKDDVIDAASMGRKAFSFAPSSDMIRTGQVEEGDPGVEREDTWLTGVRALQPTARDPHEGVGRGMWVGFGAQRLP